MKVIDFYVSIYITYKLNSLFDQCIIQGLFFIKLKDLGSTKDQ